MAVQDATGEQDPRVRNLRKKLAQIALLEEKVLTEGFEASEEQLAKLARKQDLEQELQHILEPPPPAPEPQVEEEQNKNSSADAKARVSNGHRTQDDDLIDLLQAGVHASAPQKPSKKKKKRDSTKATAEEDDQNCPPLENIDSARGRVSSHDPFGCRSPSMRWEDDPVSVEDVAPTPKAGKDRKEPPVEFIENVQPFSVATQASPRLHSLVKEVSELSNAAFEEDALEMVTRKSRWKLTLLARPEGYVPASESAFMLDGPSDEPPLIGFIVYRLRPELESFSIAKLAIVPEHRRQGHGCRLVDWCFRNARKQSSINFISLSSLPEAVKFYQRIGFKAVDVKFDPATQCSEGEDFVEGQVYMEFRLKGKSGKGKKR